MSTTKASSFEQIETSLLKQEIAILKQEKALEREQLLKDIAILHTGSQRKIWHFQLLERLWIYQNRNLEESSMELAPLLDKPRYKT